MPPGKVISTLLCLVVLLGCREPEKLSVEIAFAGDLMLARGVEMAINDDNYVEAGRQVKELLQADYGIANLEGALSANGESGTDSFRGPFNLTAHVHQSGFLKHTGVTHLSLANNHSLDNGLAGLHFTRSALKKTGIESIGASQEPTILDVGGRRIALFGACLLGDENRPWFSSGEALKQAISQYRKRYTGDYIVAYVHWGKEYASVPRASDVALSKDLVETGCDLIVGHHPHVVQTIDFIDHRPIFYSLGNFIADPIYRKTETGLVVKLHLEENDTLFELLPVDLSGFIPQKLAEARAVELLQRISAYCVNVVFVRENGKWWVYEKSRFKYHPNIRKLVYSISHRSYVLEEMPGNKAHKLSYYRGTSFLNSLLLEGEITHLEWANVINCKTCPEQFVCAIKKEVPFDQAYNLRVNVFGERGDFLQPLWLGTSMAFQLESFKCKSIDGLYYLSTLEKGPDNHSLNCLYQWDEFGFELLQTDTLNNENHP